MNRRGFLSLFGVTAATLAADPEALLWTPGAKVISIPSVIAPEPFYHRVNHVFIPKLKLSTAQFIFYLPQVIEQAYPSETNTVFQIPDRRVKVCEPPGGSWILGPR